MLNKETDSVVAFVPAALFIVLVVYLMMSDPFIVGPF